MSAAEWTALGAVAVAASFTLGRLLRRGDAGATAAPEVEASPEGDSRFEDLLGALDAGVMAVDARGIVADLNEAATVMFGLSGKVVRGRALIEVVPSFELDRRLRDALGGQASRGDVALSAGRRARRLFVAVVPRRDGDGALVVATDETRLRELERVRRDFVSNVSHELRTPLSSINLMLETILSDRSDREALELFLPRVKHEVDRLVNLVEHLLELARAENRQVPLRNEDVDLGPLAAEIAGTFEARALEAGIALQVEASEASVSGDRERLAQVVVNLIDNALRHTPAGGAVTIEAVRDGEASVLRVRDTGEGIPHADLPHIFERFYVVDRSRARPSAGSGVGLSIVRHIVEAHGGSVSVRSELGAGSLFTCVFPAKPLRARGTGAAALPT